MQKRKQDEEEDAATEAVKRYPGHKHTQGSWHLANNSLAVQKLISSDHLYKREMRMHFNNRLRHFSWAKRWGVRVKEDKSNNNKQLMHS